MHLFQILAGVSCYFAQSVPTYWDCSSNYVTTVYFHNLYNSYCTIVMLFDFEISQAKNDSEWIICHSTLRVFLAISLVAAFILCLARYFTKR